MATSNLVPVCSPSAADHKRCRSGISLDFDRTFNIHGFDVISYRSAQWKSIVECTCLRHWPARSDCGLFNLHENLHSGLFYLDVVKQHKARIKTLLSSTPLEGTARSLTQVCNLLRRQSVTRYQQRFSDLCKQKPGPRDENMKYGSLSFLISIQVVRPWTSEICRNNLWD